jgi:hypothetical protein
MEWNNIKGFKYFILYCALLFGFFAYSSVTGWSWFTTTPTESSRPAGGSYHGYALRYHK